MNKIHYPGVLCFSLLDFTSLIDDHQQTPDPTSTTAKQTTQPAKTDPQIYFQGNSKLSIDFTNYNY